MSKKLGFWNLSRAPTWADLGLLKKGMKCKILYFEKKPLGKVSLTFLVSQCNFPQKPSRQIIRGKKNN